MGNKESRKSDDKGFVTVDLASCNDNIKYSPLNSRALCLGVGRSIHIQRQSHDIPARDRDAKIVFEALRDGLAFPSSAIQLLTSDSTYSATKSNVRYCLKAAARSVKSDGILFIFFSGHATRYNGTNIGLATSDFAGDSNLLLTRDDFFTAFRELESRQTRVIILVDCCLAAALAKEIVVNLDPDYRVYVIAACSTAEKSLCADELGSGAFSYFLGRYMRKCLPGVLNMTELMDYCVPLCRALVDLVLQRDDAPVP